MAFVTWVGSIALDLAPATVIAGLLQGLLGCRCLRLIHDDSEEDSAAELGEMRGR